MAQQTTAGEIPVTSRTQAATIAGAVAHYDTARDLGVPDYDARKAANAVLCRELGIGEMAAAPLLADALARRATARIEADRRFGQPHYGHDDE
jgi:hypothetical protein